MGGEGWEGGDPDKLRQVGTETCGPPDTPGRQSSRCRWGNLWGHPVGAAGKLDPLTPCNRSVISPCGGMASRRGFEPLLVP